MSLVDIRKQLEERERQILAPQAAKSADTRGRLRPEPEDPIRPAFQRDRDRVIHCKAFRRLKHKTQVFFAPTGDHYRTRLTHTLEVSQIARSIAKVFGPASPSGTASRRWSISKRTKQSRQRFNAKRTSSIGRASGR